MDLPVIPDAAAEALAPVSPEVAAQRAKVSIAAEAVFVVGGAPVKMRESARAVELMAYLDGLYAAECKTLDNLIATEALGKPVEVNGSVLSLAKPGEASH